MGRLPRFSCLVVFFCFVPVVGFGQQVSLQPLITKPVIESELTTLKGNTHPLAQTRFDIGAAAPDLPMNRMLLVLKRSPEQEHSLRTLLDNQQDKASPHYHKWLTPSEFGTQFGPADNDVQVVTGWLQAHGFQVNRVSHGRTVIEFSGTEAQVEEALHTSIHKFAVNGEEHWANASDPQIPAALAPAVAGVASLNNFPRKPLSKIVGTYSPKTRRLTSVNPEFTLQGFGCDQDNNCYAVGPADFGAIYNVQPLWNSGVDGTGQTIAIVGETDINVQDIRDFRNLFGLPVKDPTVIYDGPNPGPQSDESEADIDVEWSGAIAPNATIDFVVSESTESTSGIDLSAIYIIDHNLAPVMSESYGACELALGTSGNQFYSTLWAQAAAQGITVILASGDDGSNGCTYGPATYGLNVSGFASTPFNVAVGGTDFNDLLNPQQYWSLNNATATQESAKGYIPETTWNLSCTNSVLLGDLGWGTNAENNCNNAQLQQYGLTESVGGSGGVSNCTTNSQALGSCSGGYSKPSWQVAPGVPADGKRDIPDVSLFASNGVMGNFYIYCQRDSSPYYADCAVAEYGAAGGTSFGAPIFAGIMALINQQTSTTEGQGNANYVLYKLASQQTASACNSATGSGASCVFNDVTAGTIAMPCVAGTPNCNVQSAGHAYGILSGYSTGTGYDLATGLGSLNVANLAANWSSVAFRSTTTSLGLSPTSSLTHGQSVTVTGSVAASSGTGTPTGKVSLLTSTGIGVDGFALTNGAISGSTNLLPGGTYTVTAHYAGDPTFGGSDSTPVSITVGKENSSTQPELVTFDWNGNLISSNASTAVYGSPYLFRVNVLNGSGVICSPNPLGESSCPSGTVTLTDNSSALDGGAFKLNSLGYTEDQLVQFPGGSNAVKATYAGDNSFNASSASTTYSITPAPTTMSAPVLQNSLSVGSQAIFSLTTQSAPTSGAAPTGTVTFYANGTPIVGSVSYSSSPSGSSSNNFTASTSAEIFSSSSPFANAGNYSITASYSGDGNYAPSTSSPTSISVKYPAPNIVTTPNAVSVAPNTPLTLTSIVDTSGKGPLPGSSITYVDNSNGNTLTGTETYIPTTDANGNTALQVTFTFTPTFSMQAQAEFAGDSNYPAAQSTNNVFITVSGNDFSLGTNPQTGLTISTPGASGSLFIIVSGQSGFNGTVNFSPSSCTGLPAEAQCSFNPSSVTGANPPFTGTQLTITTMGPHPVGLNRSWWGQRLTWTFASLMLVGAFFLAPSPRRSKSLALAAFACVFAFSAVSCGGGGGGGGSGSDPGTPSGSYTITVAGTSGSGTSAVTHTTTFTLVVQ
ncbi:MAG: peptidase and in, kexin, sedolisin [Acidobacteriaceae bacterium]|nr:peptidase and in, kexin, sedolisin [Acidobacteriaceae bacterium]